MSRPRSVHIARASSVALVAAALVLFPYRVAAQSIPLSPVAQASGAQITYSLGYEFVTIDVHNNPGYTPPGLNPNDPAYGRGSVAEPFRIGRFEVTTSQWAAFYNAWAYVSTTQGTIPFVQVPGGGFWGAVAGTNPHGAAPGWTVPAGNGMRPVGNISWRTAAILCNWLCNNQALTRDAFMSGAYDVSTFGYVNAVFTDQLVHTPGAQFYIPTLDQWIAAAHYDPNRYGVGQGGYWNWANARDTATPRGIPGVGEANWGTQPDGQLIPLGAYPTVQSPWGLLDTSGGTSEWLETTYQDNTGDRRRLHDGSSWFNQNSADHVAGWGGDYPSSSPLYYGLRIASAVPSPSSVCYLFSICLAVSHRRRAR